LHISLSCTRALLATMCVADMYRMSGGFGCGHANVGNFYM
jgi:hypothetical protein